MLFILLAAPVCSGASALAPDQTDALNRIARGERVGFWQALSERELGALGAKANAYGENYRRHHEPHGLTADVLFTDRSRSAPQKLEGIGDAATWTGHYLAAMACRHAAGEPSALDDLERALRACSRLMEVTGQTGFVARFSGPAADRWFQPYYAAYGNGPDPGRPGLGTWAFRGAGQYSNQVWLGYPSRDVYVGVNLGLATTHRLVPHARVRRTVRRLVEQMLDRLIADSWEIVDGEGRRSRGPLTETMVAALLRTGATVLPGKYAGLYEEKVRLALDAPVPQLCKPCSYYPNNLEFAVHYVLATLETHPERRTIFRRKIENMWAQARDHLNAHFAALYVSATGDRTNVEARAVVEGGLAEFPGPPRWDQRVDHTGRAGLEFRELNGRKWSRYALPVGQRVPADFLWQRSPCQLAGGSEAALAYPGLDYLLPYWMARQAGLIGSGRAVERGRDR